MAKHREAGFGHLEEYKKIQDREGTSVNREMKAFAHAEENLNAKGKKNKERREGEE